MKERYVFYPIRRRCFDMAPAILVFLYVIVIFSYMGLNGNFEISTGLRIFLLCLSLPFLGLIFFIVRSLWIPDRYVRVEVDREGVKLWKRRRMVYTVSWTQPMYILIRTSAEFRNSRSWSPDWGPYYVIFSSEFWPSQELYDETDSLNFRKELPEAGVPWRFHCCYMGLSRAQRLVRTFQMMRGVAIRDATWQEDAAEEPMA